MARVDDIVHDMLKNPAGIRFTDACTVARHFFGTERISGSHHIWKMPWPGDPRVNLQRGEGDLAKAYQVKQLLAAVERSTAEPRVEAPAAPKAVEPKKPKRLKKRRR